MMSIFRHKLQETGFAVGIPVVSVSLSPSADVIDAEFKSHTICMAVRICFTIQTSTILHQRALEDEGMIQA